MDAQTEDPQTETPATPETDAVSETTETTLPDFAEDDAGETEGATDEAPETTDDDEDEPGEETPADPDDDAYRAALKAAGLDVAEDGSIKPVEPAEVATEAQDDAATDADAFWKLDPNPDAEEGRAMVDDPRWVAEATRQAKALGEDPDLSTYTATDWRTVKRLAIQHAEQMNANAQAAQADEVRAQTAIQQRVKAVQSDEVFEDLPEGRAFYADYMGRMAGSFSQGGHSVAGLNNDDFDQFVKDAALGRAYRESGGAIKSRAVEDGVKAATARERTLRASGSPSSRPSSATAQAARIKELSKESYTFAD